MTKDEVVIISHDGDLKRICETDGKSNIYEYNYEELPSYRKIYKTGLTNE